MIQAYFARRKQRFLHWWHAPVQIRDRVLGAVVGGIAAFWVGGLGRVMLGPIPVSMSDLAWWALGSLAGGIVLGLTFPKATACVAFPFSTFGAGGGA